MILVGLFQCTISKRISVENGNDVIITQRAQYSLVVDLVTEVGRTSELVGEFNLPLNHYVP